MRRILLGITIALFWLTGCDEQECRDLPSHGVTVAVDIERLDQKLFQSKSGAEVLSLLNNNPGFTELFLDGDQYPSNQIIANKLYGLINDPYVDTLYRETQSAYSDLGPIEAEFKNTFANIKYFYPDFKVPTLQTAVTGLYKDLVITDSLIIIGLDHFLGADATYKPLDVPDYILERYTDKHMVSIIATFIGSTFNNVNLNDKTMLAEMIDFGKSYYFASRVMPCTSKHIIIGYTEKEWQDANDNDEIIWANLIENELLYETNYVLKNKFIGERPNVFEIGENCPGRIGRWVGWQIIEAYMERNPEKSLPDLMSNNNPLEIFQQSGYKPGR